MAQCPATTDTADGLATCITTLDDTANHPGPHDDGHGLTWADHAHTPSLPDDLFDVLSNDEYLTEDAGLNPRSALNLLIAELGREDHPSVTIQRREP